MSESTRTPAERGVRPAAAGDSTTGLPTRTASVLAYLGWWVTGALMLLLERRDKTVRFHAAQSVVALGAVWLLGVVVYGLAFGLLSIGARGFVSVLWLAFAIWAAGVVLWAVCLMQVIRGEQWRIPLAATVAERLA